MPDKVIPPVQNEREAKQPDRFRHTSTEFLGFRLRGLDAADLRTRAEVRACDTEPDCRGCPDCRPIMQDIPSEHACPHGAPCDICG